jgi:site-specific recombinase XerD
MIEKSTNETKCYKKNLRNRIRTYLTIEEVNRLSSASVRMSRNPIRNKCIVWTMFWFGLRVSELLSMRWSDIDFTTGTVQVRRLKGSKDSIQKIACTKYKKLLTAHRRVCAKAGYNDHVFVTQTGVPFARLSMHHLIMRMGQRAGFTFPIYPHMLRHSLGYYLANNSVPTHIIQMFLGHAAISNTTRYIEMDSSMFGKTLYSIGVR